MIGHEDLLCRRRLIGWMNIRATHPRPSNNWLCTVYIWAVQRMEAYKTSSVSEHPVYFNSVKPCCQPWHYDHECQSIHFQNSIQSLPYDFGCQPLTFTISVLQCEKVSFDLLTHLTMTELISALTMRKNFLWFTHPALVKLLLLQLKKFLHFHQVGWTISKEIFEKLIKYDGQLWRGNAQSELYNKIPLRPQKAASNSWLNRIKCFIVTKY